MRNLTYNEKNKSDGSDQIRDPGIEEEVWQELQLVIMTEELEKERIKQEEEEAQGYCLYSKYQFGLQTVANPGVGWGGGGIK
jgi:hypothetical protein